MSPLDAREAALRDQLRQAVTVLAKLRPDLVPAPPAPRAIEPR